MPGKIDKEEESYIVRDAKRATAKERYEAADKEAKHAEAELKNVDARIKANDEKRAEMGQGKEAMSEKRRKGEVNDEQLRNNTKWYDEQEGRYVNEGKDLQRERADIVAKRDKAVRERDAAKKEMENEKQRMSVNKEQTQNKNQDKEYTK